MSSEPEALRLAAWAKQLALGNQIFGGPKDREEMGLIDAELRRLHAENEAAHAVGVSQEREIMRLEAEFEADRAAMREALAALQFSLNFVGRPDRRIDAAIEKLKARTA